MLSAVLKIDIAVEVSIKIMNSFIEMRKFLISNKEIFSRLDRVELKQLEMDKKIEDVFNYIANHTEVIFNGQIYDAFSFLVNLIKKANKEIILIDNYIDVDTLNILCKKDKISDEIILKIRENLSEEEKKDLMQEAKSAPSWIYEVIREIYEGKDE